MYNFFPWVRVKILVTLLIDCLFVAYYIAMWNNIDGVHNGTCALCFFSIGVLCCVVLCCVVLCCVVLCCAVLCCAVLCCVLLVVSCCVVLQCTVLYYAVLYSTVLYCTVLYCIVLCSAALCRVVFFCSVLYRTVLYFTVQYCTVLCYISLYSTVLYCAVLYCTVPYRAFAFLVFFMSSCLHVCIYMPPPPQGSLLQVPPSGGTLSVSYRHTYPLNPSPLLSIPSPKQRAPDKETNKGQSNKGGH